MVKGVTVRSARKIGFFAALTMLLGTVVGIGITFKNHGVLTTNNWDGIGTVVAWILGGVICLTAALIFSEMGSMKTSKVHGLSGWALKVNGKAFGYFHRFNYTFFYYGLLTAALGMFTSEAITNAFVVPLVGQQPPVWMHFIIGLVLAGMVLMLNYYSVHASGILQQVMTVLNFLPLIVVVLAGVILFTTNKAPTTTTDARELFGFNSFTNGRGFNFSNMLASLPGVLFAYDAFLGVGSLSSKVIGGEKRVPLIVIVGMLIVIALYTMIGIVSAAHGSGFITGAALGFAPSDGFGIFDQIFSAEAARGMGILITVFIAVASIGVLNGISAALVATVDQALDSETLFKSSAIKKKFRGFAPLFICLAVTLAWMLILGIPMMAMDSDAVVDGMSNFPTLFSFAMYIPIIISYARQRQKLGMKVLYGWVFWLCVAVSIAGIAVGVGYQLLYSYLVVGWIDYANGAWGGTGGLSNTNWGLFVGNNENHVGMYYWQSYFVLLGAAAAFFIVPFLNAYLIRKYEKRDPYEIKEDTPITEIEAAYEQEIAPVGLIKVGAAGSEPIIIAPEPVVKNPKKKTWFNRPSKENDKQKT